MESKENCGAGLGVGIAVSVLTGATPLTGKTRALANEATAYALNKMIDGGPRCCKRASRRALSSRRVFKDKDGHQYQFYLGNKMPVRPA